MHCIGSPYPLTVVTLAPSPVLLGLSASIYRSLLYRDSVPEWDHVAADSTWMTSRPPRALNPLAIGQYVNNATIKSAQDDASVTRDPNVAYYEFDIQFPNEISYEQLRVRDTLIERSRPRLIKALRSQWAFAGSRDPIAMTCIGR